ncbi:hypothetical protein HRW18_05395 [Streptomyces lunaelactis]|uniref:hypothetical protein n=1 Tax=Streptomyces lunaelactis TaxID=1535768 RepID=UPI0015852D2C|nr:hypothetical protein [Streptomyces lunaelactis]NUK07457.1 hypothetical protein [Streptomyces lunaelactis]
MSQFPVIPPGRRVTSGLLMSMLPLQVIKQSQTLRASTTTLTADPELVLPLEASAQYIIDGHIIYGAASATPGLQCSIVGPAGSSGVWSANAPAVSAVPDPALMRWRSFGLSSSTGFGSNGSNNAGMRIHANITTTTAGNLSFNWAQSVSNATATEVQAGAWIRAFRAS